MFVVNLLGSKKTNFQGALHLLDVLHTVQDEPTGHTLLFLGSLCEKVPLDKCIFFTVCALYFGPHPTQILESRNHVH